jgi:hypothetical protein
MVMYSGSMRDWQTGLDHKGQPVSVYRLDDCTSTRANTSGLLSRMNSHCYKSAVYVVKYNASYQATVLRVRSVVAVRVCATNIMVVPCAPPVSSGGKNEVQAQF